MIVKVGTFRIGAKVWKMGSAEPKEAVELIADTGASYTTLPAPLLEGLGVERERKVNLKIADGSTLTKDVGFVGIDLGEGRRLPATPVIFGEPSVYLLGAMTLEMLSLAADPVNKRLVTVEAYLFANTG